MNAKEAAGIVLIAAAATGAGYWMGHRHAPDNAGPSTSGTETATSSSAASRSLPPVKPSKSFAPASAGDNAKLSLAELEAKLATLRDADGRSGDWRKVLNSVNASDIPRLLSAVEKNPSRSARDMLRSQLLLQWAESDPQAAMAYANAVVGKSSRDQAVLSVLRAWAEKDPTGAMEWAQQLPANQFRSSALGVVITYLANTDPQAALDLAQKAGG